MEQHCIEVVQRIYAPKYVKMPIFTDSNIIHVPASSASLFDAVSPRPRPTHLTLTPSIALPTRVLSCAPCRAVDPKEISFTRAPSRAPCTSSQSKRKEKKQRERIDIEPPSSALPRTLVRSLTDTETTSRMFRMFRPYMHIPTVLSYPTYMTLPSAHMPLYCR